METPESLIILSIRGFLRVSYFLDKVVYKALDHIYMKEILEEIIDEMFS